ncbi:MAG: NAD(P)-dependent oxidoreductase [Deltaproteobacteria bacterium]|nr:NAD(P)-dependent oxidoreductase [Deltaproteobacteria bacterium]
MRILITGATGYIGRSLVSTLRIKYDLVCFVRSAKKLDVSDKVQVIQGDLTDLNFRKLLPKDIDTIIHLAQANASFPDRANELFSVNTTATQRLADYAYETGVSHFIHFSSGNVYSKSVSPLLETSPRKSIDFYSLTKNTSEDLLRCYEDVFNISIFRLFGPYGPGQNNRIIPKIINLVRERKTITLYNDGQPRINPIYIDDLIRIIDICLSLKGYNVFNVGGPKVLSIKDIAEIAGAVLKKEPNFKLEYNPERWNLIADITKLCSLIDREGLMDPFEGISKTTEEIQRKTL